MRKRDKEQGPVGGLVFFTSLFFLLVVGLINTFNIIPILYSRNAFINLSYWLAGAIIGLVCAKAFIRGHFGILLHEFKHAIVSNLVGNTWKRMKVQGNSGEFEYKYSKQSAAYNAFIALAPYYLPVFTVLSILIAFATTPSEHQSMALIIGIGFGIDGEQNTRDISAHQTDFSNLVGGYHVGVLYVFAMNLTIITFLLAWIGQKWQGIETLLISFGQQLLLLY